MVHKRNYRYIDDHRAILHNTSLEKNILHYDLISPLHPPIKHTKKKKHIMTSFETCFNVDGSCFSLARVGRIIAVSRLQQLLQERQQGRRPNLKDMVLQQIELTEDILELLRKLGQELVWNSWKCIDCRNTFLNNNVNNNDDQNNNQSNNINPPNHSVLFEGAARMQVANFTSQTTNHFPRDATNFISLQTIISLNSTLTNLRIIHVEFTERMALEVAQGLGQTKTLQSLCFSGTRKIGRYMDILAEGLNNNTSLLYFDVGDCQLTDVPLAHLIESCKNHPNLQTLDISNNQCSTLGIQAVARDLLPHTKTLQILRLEMQRQRLDMSILGPAVAANSTLTTLNLANTHLNDADFRSVVDALCSNKTIRHINLSDNRNVTDEAVLYLAHRIPSFSSSLKILDIRKLQTRGSMQVLQAMAKGMELNYHLEFIRFNYWRHVQYTRQILYWANANRGGRVLLTKQDSVPLGVWPLLFERAQNKHYFAPLPCQSRLDNVYYMFRNAPFLWEHRN